MTKLKLNACEQRWVAKLASYTFGIKHIPGPKNVVADTFLLQKSVGQRLISEPYETLLAEAEGAKEDKVQHIFHCKV